MAIYHYITIRTFIGSSQNYIEMSLKSECKDLEITYSHSGLCAHFKVDGALRREDSKTDHIY